MKPEEYAWRALNDHAATQLRGGFADRVVRAAQGPQAETWRALLAVGARQLRPGFAERVLRAARAAVEMPSLASQFALSAVTAAVCLAAVVFVHQRNAEAADERNLAQWQQMVLVALDDTAGL
jgi:negative regulator of sigma E activity